MRITGSTKNINRKSTTLNMIFSSILWFKIDCTACLSPASLFIATNEVVATEKPIANDIAIKIAVLPKAAAPSSVIPTLPTITLSTNPTRVCPSIPNMTG